MKNKLSLREWFGKNYDELLTILFSVYYIILKTGKGGKKSRFVAKLLVLLAVLDPFLCGVIMRKIMKDHGPTTFAEIESAFKELKEKTGYDYKKEWVIAPSSQNPKIYNTRTGQVFRFSSFDRPNSLAGFTLNDKNLYYGPIWFEEPLQIGDLSNQPSFKDQKQEERNWEIAQNSIHRGQLPHKWAHRWVIKTFNDWSNGNHWIINKFVKRFIKEDVKTLDTKGKQVYFDPNFEEGKGLFVMVASAGINEFLDSKFLKRALTIRNNDFEFYKAIWLGTRANFSGNAYGQGNMKNIRRDIDLSLVEQFAIGWDYASSKDKTAICLVGLNRKTFDMQIIDGWTYHRGQVENPLSEPELIKVMMAVIVEWIKKHNFSAPDLIATISGDSKDTTVQAFLEQEYDNLPRHYKAELDRPQPTAKFRSSSSFVRIMATRWLMGAGKLRIAPHLDDWYDAFQIREILIDGNVKDGNDDEVQSFEYAWSWDIDNLIPYEHYQILIDQQEVKIWEKWENENQVRPPGL